MEHLKLRKHSVVPLLSNVSTAHFCSPWEPTENAFLWFKACSEKPSPQLLSQKTIFCFAALRKHSFYNSSSSSVRSRLRRGERQEKNNDHLALWMTARWGKDPRTQQSRMKSGKGNYNGENIELQEMHTWVEECWGESETLQVPWNLQSAMSEYSGSKRKLQQILLLDLIYDSNRS